MKLMWFGCGTLFGLTLLSLSYGSVPSTQQMRVTDDTAIYQRLSEISVAKSAKPDFDGDINRLSTDERRYHEVLPQLKGPMTRISAQPYRYSGVRTQPPAQARKRQQAANQ